MSELVDWYRRCRGIDAEAVMLGRRRESWAFGLRSTERSGVEGGTSMSDCCMGCRLE